MPVHQATADENAEHRALCQILLFSSFDYDGGGSYGKSLVNIIPYVNWNECVLFVLAELLGLSPKLRHVGLSLLY